MHTLFRANENCFPFPQLCSRPNCCAENPLSRIYIYVHSMDLDIIAKTLLERNWEKNMAAKFFQI